MLIKYTMLCLLFALALNGVGNVTSKPKEIKKIASRFSSLGKTYTPFSICEILRSSKIG
jgi:hypothetical protein